MSEYAKVCKINDCTKKASKRKMCETHYRQWWRTNNPQLVTQQNKRDNERRRNKNKIRCQSKKPKKCNYCNESFIPPRIDSNFCSKRCWYTDRHIRKRNTDINFKLKHNIRTRLRKAIKNRDISLLKATDCSIEYLKKHLESQFQPGMSWENYGEWHIDHIIPLSSFNLENREELLKACHYTNLQPLLAEENLSKGDKIRYEDDYNR